MAQYLENCTFMYADREGVLRQRPMSYGLPQGPVFEILLWNVGCDWVFQDRHPPWLGIACYADDTLVIARGRTFKRQRALPPGVSLVVGRIAALGLWEALDKRQALLFHGPVRVRPLAHPSWSTRSSYQFGPKLSIWA